MGFNWGFKGLNPYRIFTILLHFSDHHNNPTLYSRQCHKLHTTVSDPVTAVHKMAGNSRYVKIKLTKQTSESQTNTVPANGELWYLRCRTGL